MRGLIARIRRLLPRPARSSLNDLDAKLAPYLSFRNGFFIEAGANDGYAQSNTHYLERKLGWHGLLVEGIPELYARCVRQRPGSTVVNCALVADDYPRTTATMHYANLMSVVDGAMKSPEAQATHLAIGAQVQHLPASYSVEVPARTLESLLDDIPGPPTIDFLSLDVEGYELDVLRGLNIEKFRPRYILVEARFFEEVDGFLTGHRYSLVDRLSVHDYLYRTG